MAVSRGKQQNVTLAYKQFFFHMSIHHIACIFSWDIQIFISLTTKMLVLETMILSLKLVRYVRYIHYFILAFMFTLHFSVKILNVF